MSDNKQPDALDRLRRRPAPSATPTPVVKDTPLLNDEARKLLEEKSKAAAMATKRAAEAGAKKSLEAGKAALGKFNSWRHDRAEAKVKVEAPVEALAPMEGITPSEVAEALAEREAALPVAEAPPMAVAPSGEEITDTMAKDQLLGAANTLKALVEDEEEREVPEAERQRKWSVPGLKKVLDTADASGGEPSGMLVLDGMGSLPQGELRELITDVVVLEPGQASPLADLTGDEVASTFELSKTAKEAQAHYIEQRVQQAYEKLSAENPGAIIYRNGTSLAVVRPEAIEEVLPEVLEAPVVKPGNVTREAAQFASAAKPTKAPSLMPYWIAAAVLAVVALGLMTYKLTQRDAPVAPAVEPISAPVSQPVPPAPTPEPVQVAPSPAPAPVAVEVVPAVIEPAPVIPAPVAEPEVQVIKPAKPVAVEKPVVRPAPKPVAVAKPQAVEKPKAPNPAPAPAVSPESKKQIDSIRDFEKQLENMGG